MSAEMLYAQPGIEGIDLSDLVEGFDVAGAFKGSMHDVLSDESLTLDEKVRRAASIVNDASSDLGMGFHDLREMAAIAEMYCAHDHDMQNAVAGNENISTFLSAHKQEDGHDHAHAGSSDKKKDKKKSKKKTRLSLFEIMQQARKSKAAKAKKK